MGTTNLPWSIAAGAGSGTVATIPMTAAMELLRYALLRSRSGTFPPRQVAVGILEWSGLNEAVRPLGEPAVVMITAATHLAFGGVAGALYGAGVSCLGAKSENAAIRGDGPAAAMGAAFGVFVWIASYFGWLPALGIVKPQGDYPVRKNLILGFSHLVWGAASGLIFHRLQQRRIREPISETHQALP